jgi:hypothetical protein
MRVEMLIRLSVSMTIAALGVGCRKSEPVDPTKEVFADFSKRVDDYVTLRNRLADSVTPLDDTKSQTEIASRATALGKAIMTSRAAVKPGQIFTPEVATVIATLIQEEYRRRPPPVQETRDDQQDELPDFVPAVNQLYPTTHPLATFPASLLPLLPRLPEELEYRVVQRCLILRDVEANVIVDIMPDAVP